MSNESNEPTEKVELSAEEIKRNYDGVSVDWFLQTLVGWVNAWETFEFGITLNVQGCLISGVLIGGKRFFTEFASLFAGSEDAEGSNIVRETILSFGNTYGQSAESSPNMPVFIHLRDARVHDLAGTIPSNTGTLWRGKINAVSGFSLGMLSRSSD